MAFSSLSPPASAAPLHSAESKSRIFHFIDDCAASRKKEDAESDEPDASTHSPRASHPKSLKEVLMPQKLQSPCIISFTGQRPMK